jgi:hypothetical protein
VHVVNPRSALIGLGVVIYLLGYLWCRTSHVIVHLQGYSGGWRYVGSHSVQAGDMSPDPVWGLGAAAVELIYKPLVLAELDYWNLTRPPGSAQR